MIDLHIVLPDLEKKEDLLWGFLLMTGYLKQIELEQEDDSDEIHYSLSIPNREVRLMYRSIIQSYFSDKMGNEKLELLLKSLLAGDIKQFERYFAELVQSVFSFHDLSNEPECVYHAFVAGLLVWLGNGYEVTSNRESGYGRYDIVIIPRESHKIGYVIEFKKVDKEEKETMESALESALKQIQEKQYAKTLRDRGISRFIEMAIVFSGKKIKVKTK